MEHAYLVNIKTRTRHVDRSPARLRLLAPAFGIDVHGIEVNIVEHGISAQIDVVAACKEKVVTLHVAIDGAEIRKEI